MRLSLSLIATVTVLILYRPIWAHPTSPENSWLLSTQGRLEYQLSHPVGSASTLKLLQTRSPEVQIPRRIRPGTARRHGYRKDVETFLSRAREQGLLGPRNPVHEFRIVHGNPKEIEYLLSVLVPVVFYRVDGQTILAMGEPGSLDQVASLQSELDIPLNRVLTEVKLVEFTPEGLRGAGLGWHTPSPVSETVIEAVNGQKLEPRVNDTFFRAGYFTRGCR